MDEFESSFGSATICALIYKLHAYHFLYKFTTNFILDFIQNIDKLSIDQIYKNIQIS